jgi:hypothetical protein
MNLRMRLEKRLIRLFAAKRLGFATDDARGFRDSRFTGLRPAESGHLKIFENLCGALAFF